MQATAVFAAISGVICIFTWIYCVYHVFIAFFGLKKLKSPKKLFDKQHKFTAVISARNEETVIANLVNSLKQQRYPQELLDIIVIADNCTDHTAQEAEAAGAAVYIRSDAAHATKGFALQWLFEQLLQDEKFDSDAVFIFDADNVVDSGFVQAMNEQLCCGAEMGQGYRDSKNPGDNWISGAHSIYFWTLMRFCLRSRRNLNMSGFFGGTGFMVKTDILRRVGGWNTKEISEDVEFSMYRIAEGGTIAFVPDAKFYDEQPVKFSQSWKQRVRWTTGNWKCIKSCVPGLWNGRKKSFKGFVDGFMFLMSVPSVLLGMLGLLFSFAAVLTAGKYMTLGLVGIVLSLVLSYLAMMLEAVFIVVLEKKRIRDVWKGILGFPIFLITFMFASFWGVVKPVKKWTPIEHECSRDIDEVEEKII